MTAKEAHRRRSASCQAMGHIPREGPQNTQVSYANGRVEVKCICGHKTYVVRAG